MAYSYITSLEKENEKLRAQVKALAAERDAARQALIDLAPLAASNWSSATTETRKAYDAALKMQKEQGA